MKLPIDAAEDPEIQIAPLIDMVFLLLVYFMVTASLIKSEADLGMRIPGMLKQAQAVELPDEQIIEVKETGHVILNGRAFDRPDVQELPELVTTLIRYRQSTEAAGLEPLVTISAENVAYHQRVIDVLNACAEADIEGVTFSIFNE